MLFQKLMSLFVQKMDDGLIQQIVKSEIIQYRYKIIFYLYNIDIILAIQVSALKDGKFVVNTKKFLNI
jgi:hypothetical protein